MDETRAQAYLNLIQQLLTCPNGEEPQVLQANLDIKEHLVILVYNESNRVRD